MRPCSSICPSFFIFSAYERVFRLGFVCEKEGMLEGLGGESWFWGGRCPGKIICKNNL